MHRIDKLYPILYSFENLLLAFKKAKKGTKTAESMQFDFNLEKELLQLSEELKNNSYQPSEYRYFTIFEPKERLISVATFRDRVVHHAIVNLLEPIYEKTFIYHSYATRKNKGTHAAIQMAQEYLRKNTWFLKCDIKKYFDSINHQILMKQISSKIKDVQLLALMQKIIENAGAGVSLPIGNLTSQFFANIYLNEFDHFVKEKLRCRYYIRYMDDFVVFENNKAHLKEIKKQIIQFLETLHCKINPKSSYFNMGSNGMSFLGLRIYKEMKRLKRENLKRSFLHCKLRKYEFESGKITEQKFVDCTHSIFSYVALSSTLQLRRQWINKLGYLT